MPNLFALVLRNVVNVWTMRALAAIGFAAEHPLRDRAAVFLLRMILFGFLSVSHISSEFQDPQHTVNVRLFKVCNFSRCLSSSRPAVRALTPMENWRK